MDATQLWHMFHRTMTLYLWMSHRAHRNRTHGMVDCGDWVLLMTTRSVPLSGRNIEQRIASIRWFRGVKSGKIQERDREANA